MYNGNTPATDLRNAAFVVEMPGNWTRGTMFNNRTGAMCAGGAIHAVTNMKIVTVDYRGTRFDPQAVLARGVTERLAAATFILMRSLDEALSIPYWNDNVVNGPEEVAAQMRLAADRWEAENPDLAQSVRQADLDLASGPVV